MPDKFHEECGVFAVYGHPEAANLAYLGLYALSTAARRAPASPPATGARSTAIKAMGHVADIFTPELLAQAARATWPSATRATRPPATRCCSTRSRSSVACNKGRIAVAHNGNLTNAAELRRELERRRLDLPGVQRHRGRSCTWWRARASAPWPARCARRCSRWRAPFRWSSWPRTASSWRAIPSGFRPLAMGQMELSGGKKCYVFASETCAFDLIGAVYLSEVEPGEMVIAGPEGLTRERYAPEQPRAHCVFEHVYFSRPDSIVFGRPVQQSPRNAGTAAGAGAPGRGRRGRAGARLGRGRGHRLLGRDPASRSATG